MTPDGASRTDSDSDTGTPLFQSDLTLAGLRRGKVRDVYRLDEDRTLIVASDRVSVFDVVLATPIAGKGRLLTQIAAFWLRWIEDHGLCRTHLLSTDADEIPDGAFGGSTTRDDLRKRVMIVRSASVLPVEFVVRGYLEGSGWKEYQQTGSVCGIELPRGLRRRDRLPEPIFTPATKAPQGAHDENISFDRACDIVGDDLMRNLRERSLAIYRQASAYALQRGIIIADTKFEFGIVGDEAILVDEALTPDSSRFWPADDYEPGRAQRSFDKQYVRDFLQEACDRGEWDKTPPGPALPPEVVRNTIARYREARDRLLGPSRVST